MRKKTINKTQIIPIAAATKKFFLQIKDYLVCLGNRIVCGKYPVIHLEVFEGGQHTHTIGIDRFAGPLEPFHSLIKQEVDAGSESVLISAWHRDA